MLSQVVLPKKKRGRGRGFDHLVFPEEVAMQEARIRERRQERAEFIARVKSVLRRPFKSKKIGENKSEQRNDTELMWDDTENGGDSDVRMCIVGDSNKQPLCMDDDTVRDGSPRQQKAALKSSIHNDNIIISMSRKSSSMPHVSSVASLSSKQLVLDDDTSRRRSVTTSAA